MNDLISRQAAIDVVNKNTFRLTFAEEQNCEGHVAWSANAVYSDVMEGALLELPSVQPQQKGEPIAMAEIKVPIQVNLPDDWIEQIVNRLRNDPEAEWVEIVRCKDCKYWREHKYAKETKRYIPFCGFNAINTKADDYCSYAERRTDEQTD